MSAYLSNPHVPPATIQCYPKRRRNGRGSVTPPVTTDQPSTNEPLYIDFFAVEPAVGTASLQAAS